MMSGPGVNSLPHSLQRSVADFSFGLLGRREKDQRLLYVDSIHLVSIAVESRDRVEKPLRGMGITIAIIVDAPVVLLYRGYQYVL